MKKDRIANFKYLKSLTADAFGELRNIDYIQVTKTSIQLKWDSTLPPEGYEKTWLGIDPGQVNMGIAWFRGNSGEVFQIRFPGKSDIQARLFYANQIMNWTLSQIPMAQHTCVEQAAFGAAFGQVPLAENRAALVMALTRRGWPTSVVPPKSIRKAVFSSGDILAQDVWPFLRVRIEGIWHMDTASALACALCAQQAWILSTSKESD